MKALFVCFGCLSNTGRLTGVAGLKAIEKIGIDKANISCLAALATKGKLVMDKTKEAEKIVVDGCPLKCAKKIIEYSGFKIDQYINLVEDLHFEKGKPLDYTDEDFETVVNEILRVLGKIG